MSSLDRNLAQLEIAFKAGTPDQEPELLTTELLRSLKIGDDQQNGFQFAARHGLLSKLPLPVMTHQNLRLDDKSLRSSYHIAARNGHLMQIPLFEDDANLTGDILARSVLHCVFLSEFSDLKFIPHHFLTPQCFDAQDYHGDTPVHYAARGGKLKQILEHNYIPFTSLFNENSYGVSPLADATMGGLFEQLPLPDDMQSLFPQIKKHVLLGKMAVAGNSIVCQKADIWLASCAQKVLASQLNP